MDGLDPDPRNPDTDKDGVPDGLELGIQNPIPSCYVGATFVGGTNVNVEFNWTFIAGKTVRVHNYTKDTDPTTKTDPKRADSDGDGLKDGIEEADISRLNFTGTPALSSTDLNGKLDGPNETNPLDMDTDNDGLVDGIRNGKGEDLNLNGLRDSSETNPCKFDTDGDGLGDGLELGLTLADITKDTNTDIFRPDADPNPATNTDPTKADSDGDGVPDGWVDGWICDPSKNPIYGKYGVPDGQFQFGEGEDKNLNGKVDPTETNPNMKDSDGDELLDGWDLIGNQGQYSGIFSTQIGATSKYRFWGELNYTTHNLAVSGPAKYQSAPTDPTSTDSDGDGLVDGIIQNKPSELVTSHNGKSQTMYTDPSLMDTDNDGLSDGLEVSGWEVHIILEKTKKEVSNRTVYSNPTVQDGDHDGINDYNEFLNSSDPWNNDTDGDHILDGNESVGELTQIDGKDPEILKFSDGSQVHLNVKFVYDSVTGIIPVGLQLVASVKVGDNAGIDYVKIKISGQKAKTSYLMNSPRTATVDISFSFDWMRSLTNGYDVNITVADVNGNGNCTTTHVDGLAEGLVKALIKGWNSFVENVKKLASAAIEWIWNAINSLFNNIIKPIVDAFNNWIEKLYELWKQVVIETVLNIINGGPGLTSTPAWKTFKDFLIDQKIVIILMIVFIIVDVIFNLASPFLLIVQMLFSLLLDYIGPIIVSFFSPENKKNNAKIDTASAFLTILPLSTISKFLPCIIKPDTDPYKKNEQGQNEPTPEPDFTVSPGSTVAIFIALASAFFELYMIFKGWSNVYVSLVMFLLSIALLGYSLLATNQAVDVLWFVAILGGLQTFLSTILFIDGAKKISSKGALAVGVLLNALCIGLSFYAIGITTQNLYNAVNSPSTGGG